MKFLLVYDSVFGNTEQIALAIGESLGSEDEAGIFHVGDVKLDMLSGIDCLIVGSPTRAFRPTKEITGFLKNIPDGSLKGVKVASFDTRLSIEDVNNKVLKVMVKFFGYAAKPIADRLSKKGGTLVLPPEGFYVKDTEGPLKDGEIDRAKDWGSRIKGSL